MQYTRYTISIASKPKELERDDLFDLIAAQLAEEGFDSFEQQDDLLLAYVPSDVLNCGFELRLEEALGFEGLSLDYYGEEMPEVNWNEEWEKNYFQPIIIGDKLCQIRAPFHEADTSVKTEVIINPKMAFGTGNHETTALMMNYILEHRMQGKRVLDMGCGTGILGILALKEGAKSLTAIDIDEWAYLNVRENATLNDVEIELSLQGDASTLQGLEAYDVIFANITRNILLSDMPAYSEVLHPGGSLVLSGFYEEDIPTLLARAEELGLVFASSEVRNKWARLEVTKQK